MKRIDSSTAVIISGKSSFTDGTVPTVPPTTLISSWCNNVQEEICSVIAAANPTITLDGTNYTQLLAAIRTLFPVPTLIKFTASGTYTPTSANVRYIIVRAFGGGGGGGGSFGVGYTPYGASGGNGGATTFITTIGSTSILSAGGGTGASSSTQAAPIIAAGGTGTLGTGITGTIIPGSSGRPNRYLPSSDMQLGGAGGDTPLLMGGGSGFGAAGRTNSGGGGGGGQLTIAGSFTGYTGAGGGSGCYVTAIVAPTALQQFNVTIQPAGTAGGAGTSTAGFTPASGGIGGTGYLEVEEHYV